MELPPNVWDDFTQYPPAPGQFGKAALQEDLDCLQASYEEVVRQRKELLRALRSSL